MDKFLVNDNERLGAFLQYIECTFSYSSNGHLIYSIVEKNEVLSNLIHMFTCY